MNTIGVGLLGCGRISTLHALSYRGLPGAKLVAVCDKNAALAKSRATEWGIEKVYTRAEELFADAAVDMVEILLPHHLHAPMTIAAAEAGKHISVQKPMACSIDECDAMIEAARKADVMLRVFEQFVFYPPYVKARQILDSGQLGEPVMMRLHYNGGLTKGGWKVPLASWLWRLSPQRCGGGPVVFDHGYHLWSMARWIMGPARSIVAWIDSTSIVPMRRVDCPATAMIRFEHAKRYAVLDFAWTPRMRIDSKYYADDNRIEIICERGAMMLNTCTSKTFELPPLLVYSEGKTETIRISRTDWSESFTDCTRHFIEAIRQHSEPCLSGEDGKAVTEMALAAIRSSEEGREVSLPLRD